MNQPDGAQGTLLKDILGQLSFKLGPLFNGNAGIYDSGALNANEQIDPCADAQKVFSLQPVGPERQQLTRAINSVAPGKSNLDPLNLAVINAYSDLLQHSSQGAVDRILTIFTVGPDTCRSHQGGIERVLHMLSMPATGGQIRTFLEETRLLTLTVAIAFTEQDREAWSKDADMFEIDDTATALLLASSDSALKQIQTDILDLGSTYGPARSRACRDLIEYADFRSTENIENYCRKHSN